MAVSVTTSTRCEALERWSWCTARRFTTVTAWRELVASVTTSTRCEALERLSWCTARRCQHGRERHHRDRLT